MNSEDFFPGVYNHFKGGRYRALLLAQSEATLEYVVIYVHLDDGSVWTRPLESWCEPVTWPDGKTYPRFMEEP